MAREKAISQFLQASEVAVEMDLAFGNSGLLIGCALLLETLSPEGAADRVLALGRCLATRVERSLGDDERGEPPMLGVAHGTAGKVLALLRWSEVARAGPPKVLEDIVLDLAQAGQPTGRGMYWPHQTGREIAHSAVPASWCNGAAGFVHLWTSVYRWSGEQLHAELAHQAAWERRRRSGCAGGPLLWVRRASLRTPRPV